MQTRATRLGRRWATGGVLAAAVVAAAVVWPVAIAEPAFAHNVLVASTPEAGQTLTELPDEFSITTNEPLLTIAGSNGFAIQVRDADGAYYGDGCVEIVDATMSATPALGDAGSYTMLWQAISGDGHSINGEIPFTWQPAGDVTPSLGSATPPVCGEASVTPSASAEPVPSASPSGQPSAAPEPDGIDLATVLWIGGALLAVGLAIAAAIALASRRTSS